jgi:hypothetical protein
VSISLLGMRGLDCHAAAASSLRKFIAVGCSCAGSAGTSLRLLTAAGDSGLPELSGAPFAITFGTAAFGLADEALLLLLLLPLLTTEEPLTGLSLAFGALSTEAVMMKIECDVRK